MYSEQVSTTATSGSANVTLSGLPVPLLPGDALVLAGSWYEVVSQEGTTAVVQPAYAGPSQSATGTLIRFTSSQTAPSLRLQAEYEMDKLTQKLGQELIHFLSN